MEDTVFDMSDSEFMEQFASGDLVDVSDEGAATESATAEDDASTDEIIKPEETGGEEDDPNTEEADTDEDESTDDAEESSETDDDDEGTSDEETNEDVTSDNEDTSATDFEAELTSLLAPVKANGKEHEIKDNAEARRLMEMGLGFHEKMRQIKPHNRVIKTLEQHKLLDNDAELNYLLDLKNHNPEAIAKLLKDSKFDQLDSSLEEGQEYKPQQQMASDSDVAFDEILTGLRSEPTFGRLTDVVAGEWDEKSRATIGQAPQLLQIINDHMRDGYFDTITREVDRRRLLSNELTGIADLEAYRIVGDELHAQGAFDKEVKPPAESGKSSQASQSGKVTSGKKAAAPTKRTANAKPKSPPAEKDYSNVSDEDFLAQFNL